MLRPACHFVVALAFGTAASAQQVPVLRGQLQQIPPAPAPQSAAPRLEFEQRAPAAATVPGGPKVRVQALRITGQTLFSEGELVAATGFQPNSDLDLGELRALAARITDHYTRHGYFLARAYVPEQGADTAIVTIAVIEGRYGTVGLKNATNLSDRTANAILAGLASGDVVASAPLERRLLLLGDIAGVTTRSTLSPGTAPGTSDLLVALEPGRRVTGSAEADNAGNRYTGAWRAGGTVNLNNAAGIGDVLSLRVLTSFSGLAYGRASYQALLGKATVGIAYAHIDYRLGREFASLGASGNAEIASLYASYPLVRSRDANLYLLGGVDAKWFQDKLGFIASDSHRRAQVASVGVASDWRDGLGGGGRNGVGGGGRNAITANVAFGNLDIRDPLARAQDAATARTNGSFGKLTLGAERVQSISPDLSLYGSVRGQLAFGNLDISEKMELGGAYAVRAYPEGEAYGDQGYVATIETRLLLDRLLPAAPGHIQLFAFIDVGAVDFVRDPWVAGVNHANRSAYGAGVSWVTPGNLLLKATYARKLGTAAATSAPDQAGRFWFQLAKTF